MLISADEGKREIVSGKQEQKSAEHIEVGTTAYVVYRYK
jgi:hypothetical protein